VQLYRYFVSQSSEFCRHNPLYCFLTSKTKGKRIFRYLLSPETFGYTFICYKVGFWVRYLTNFNQYTTKLGQRSVIFSAQIHDPYPNTVRVGRPASRAAIWMQQPPAFTAWPSQHGLCLCYAKQAMKTAFQSEVDSALIFVLCEHMYLPSLDVSRMV
jgi:hypothetical protein